MSLKSLFLRDFVIVHQLEIELAKGFTVLTGETGAGKSILIDALQLALGARAEASVVREGAPRCEITACFDAPAGLRGWLEDAGFAAADELLLKRTVDSQGKSRAWINGSPATATQLRELGERLVDIHGQHAWQSLTRADDVKALLDAYAGVSTETLKARWQDWRQSRRALDEARQTQQTLAREQERLSWQIGELAKLAPAAGEWEELNARHSRLSHAQALQDAVQGAIDALQEADDNAAGLLSRALDLLQAQAPIEPRFEAITEVLASALAQAEDAAHSLSAYARHAELDPQSLAELDERLALWMSLARRYRNPPAELPALLEGWKQELRRLDAAADLDALERASQAAERAYREEAKALSKTRATAAPQLARAITAAMQGLGMPGGKFEVALEPLTEPEQHGMEQVQFLVAGHPGATARPVAKVASGGELSRIALAIAVTTSGLGQAQTLIFDEVDAGVGGAVAQTVGQLMKKLGRDRQVMAVTHLPQVAACADAHLLVSKESRGQSTASRVRPVDGPERVQEIARMLGGERLSETSLAHAREMLSP
ncbi:MAG: DNA repair protein RecN [Betaproteobacteria bacterium]